jgi:uncharacterized membrane protein
VRHFFKSQFTFLLYGFVFWLPIAVLIIIVAFVLNNVESIGRNVLQFFIPEQYLHYGFGIVFGILIVYVSGVVLQLTRVRAILSKIPILGLFLSSGEMMTVDRLMHLAPCVFLLSPSCLAYGWILSEENVKIIQNPSGIILINVYYPAVPAMVTGEVLPIRKDSAIKLGNSSKEIIDLLLYAFRSPKDIIYLPWDNETEEDFIKRANSFGLDLKISGNKLSQKQV